MAHQRILHAGRALTAALVAAFATSCGGGEAGSPVSSGEPAVAVIMLDQPIFSMVVGTSHQITATLRSATGAVLTGRTVEWTAEDPSILQVTSTGKVVAHAVGTTHVLAICEGRSALATITVTALPAIARLVLLPTRIVLQPGTSMPLSLLVYDSAGVALGPDVYHSALSLLSTDPGIATVDTTGRVLALAPGGTQIIAWVGPIQATTMVSVMPPYVPVAGEWSGTYTLDSYNGSAIPTPVSSGWVDDGDATLWPSGYYELHVNWFDGKGTRQLLFDSGHWFATTDGLQFVRGTRTNVGTSALAGTFAVAESIGTLQRVGYRRVAAAPDPPVRPFDAVYAPTFSATAWVRDTLSAIMAQVTLTILNTDIISRTLAFPSCPVMMAWTADSSAYVRTNVVAWTQTVDQSCSGIFWTSDVIGAGKWRTHSVFWPVKSLAWRSPTIPPYAPGKYFVWAVTFDEAGLERAVPAGWVTLP